MNKRALQAIAYAQNALSFLFLGENIKDNIKKIYLFGSAVRGELEKESDIDLFIDVEEKPVKEIEKAVASALSRFYQSNDYEKWKQMKFTYPFSFQVGELEKWELKTSVFAEGILLYSREVGFSPLERQVLFIIQLPKNKKKYLSFIREMYGRKEYLSKGRLEQAKGKKISTNIIILPKENQTKIEKFLQKEKINYSLQEIAVFG
ncbi:MAG: nucleotidyltransferase domain-containing protein [bacterium]